MAGGLPWPWAQNGRQSLVRHRRPIGCVVRRALPKAYALATFSAPSQIGRSRAGVLSTAMASSGSRLWAATPAPRRPISSCTVKAACRSMFDGAGPGISIRIATPSQPSSALAETQSPTRVTASAKGRPDSLRLGGGCLSATCADGVSTQLTSVVQRVRLSTMCDNRTTPARVED